MLGVFWYCCCGGAPTVPVNDQRNEQTKCNLKPEVVLIAQVVAPEMHGQALKRVGKSLTEVCSDPCFQASAHATQNHLCVFFLRVFFTP